MLRPRAMCALSPSSPSSAVSPASWRAALSAGVLLACVFFPQVGCSTQFRAAGAEAGAEAGTPTADGSSDTDSSSSDASLPCKVGPPYCVNIGGTSFIATCRSTNRPPDLAPCGTDCSQVRCTSECAKIELSSAAQGCLFYGFRADNIDSDIGQSTMLILSSASQLSADVEVQARGNDGNWVTVASTPVPPRGGKRLSLDQLAPLATPGVFPRAAFRITATNPIMAIQITSDDVGGGARSSGGTVLRPFQALGSRHLAMTYQQLSSANVANTAGSRAGAGTLVIVSTHDATTVNITPSTDAFVNPDGIMISPAGVAQTVVLSEGDALQILSATADGDLTGTLVETDHPVAAFSGNVYSTYGKEVTGFNGGDLAIEQLPPVESWGTEYVGAWLSPQANCDPFFGPETGLWTVMAADDNTNVTISPAAGVTLDVTPNLTLDRGTARTFLVHGVPAKGASPAIPGDFYVSAGPNRILLGQWLECEPALSLGIDLRRHGTSTLPLTLPPSFDHEIVLVREHTERVLLDGAQIVESHFLSTVDGARYDIARISQGELGTCTDAMDPCDHVIDGAFGVTWRGMDVVCSYAVTVPSRGTGCALPGQGCTN